MGAYLQSRGADVNLRNCALRFIEHQFHIKDEPAAGHHKVRMSSSYLADHSFTFCRCAVSGDAAHSCCGAHHQARSSVESAQSWSAPLAQQGLCVSITEEGSTHSAGEALGVRRSEAGRLAERICKNVMLLGPDDSHMRTAARAIDDVVLALRNSRWLQQGGAPAAAAATAAGDDADVGDT